MANQNWISDMFDAFPVIIGICALVSLLHGVLYFDYKMTVEKNNHEALMRNCEVNNDL